MTVCNPIKMIKNAVKFYEFIIKIYLILLVYQETFQNLNIYHNLINKFFFEKSIVFELYDLILSQRLICRMLFRFSGRLRNVSQIIRVNQQSVRYLSLTLPDQKIIQFKLSDIGEGTKEVVVKGNFI